MAPGARRFSRDALSRVVVPDDASLRPAAWTLLLSGVRFETMPETGEEYVLACKGGLDATTTALFFLSLLNDGGTPYLKVAFWDSVANAEDGYSRLANNAATIEIGPGAWFALAIAWNPVNEFLYLYGAARGTATSPAGTFGTIGLSAQQPGALPSLSTEPIRIGCGVDAAGDEENGSNVSLADVALFDANVSLSTLTGYLTTRLTGNETNLVGLWPMDEADSGTAYDRAGGFDGAELGSPRRTTGPEDLRYPHGLLDDGGGLVAWHDGASRSQADVACSDEASSNPASNLRSPLRAVTSRTAAAGPGAKAWTWDFGAPIPVWAVLVANHNLTSAAGGGSSTVSLHDADSWGSPDVDEVVRYHPGVLAHILTRPGFYRYLRFQTTDASNPDGYLEIGLLAAFVAWPSPRPFRVARPSRDASTAVETQHRDRTGRTRGTPARDLEVSLEDLRRGHALELRRICREAASSFVWVVPDASLDLYGGTYGVLEGLPVEKLAGPSGELVTVAGLRVREDTP